ncbi:MAG: ABC transporter ATP-binding protein [Geminicoccaceae bacterium]
MADTQPIVSIQGVTKRFGRFTAVEPTNLDIPRNAFFALLGPSGCGKTTLLRMLAGFESPTEGKLLIDGQDMSTVPPNRRPVNMVFQSYAVFPHMTVADNVAYGLKVTGVPAAEIGPRVAEALAKVKLTGFEARRPDQLSGGQRQRVALARALVKRPKVLLLDEPLSALDKKLREEMQLELVRLQHEVGITFIVVTHDQEEALSMADHIAVMEKGRILQIAPPRELYEHPNCRFVAGFIGAMNLFEAEVKGTAQGKARLEVRGIGPLDVPVDDRTPAPGAATLAVRPEKIRLETAEPPGSGGRLHGRIEQLAYFGDTSQVYVGADDGVRVSVMRHNASRSADNGLAVGQPVWLSFAPEDAILLTD